MIAAVEGILEKKGDGKATIRVGGFSIEVHVPQTSLEKLGPTGKPVRLHTHLFFKEESTTLYGFISEKELDLFKLLLGVNGVGPRVAQNILSGGDCERIIGAIKKGDDLFLSHLPGLGKKTASRIVLELRGKLDKDTAATLASSSGETADLMEALLALGYTSGEAARAISALECAPDTSLEDKLRLALRQLI